jgi:heat shock protein HslJ
MQRKLLIATISLLTALSLSACVKQQEPEVNEAASADDAMQNDPPGMVLEGMFRYMADAAQFRDCRSGKSFPVAMEAKYIVLERAYLESRVEAGSEVMVRLRGRYLERPPMEGKRMEVQLIVEEVNEVLPDGVCEPSHHTSLLDTYWKLLELQGAPVVTPEDMREAHVILASSESRTHGFSGCNNFFGSYKSGGNSLSFSAMGSTMMACAESMETEKGFFDVLGKTTRFEISGQFLQIYAGDHLLARFEAVYL